MAAEGEDTTSLTTEQREAFEKVFAEMAGVTRAQLADWIAENYMIDLDTQPELKELVDAMFGDKVCIQRDDFVELACQVVEKVM